MAGRPRTGWLADVVVGGGVGAVVGILAAVNLVIFAGLESGYESSLAEVFDRSTLLGLVVVAILVAGPALGIWVARRQRARKSVGEKVSR